jgi:hypothetical protein
MPQAPGSLSQEQERTLRATHTALKSMTVYLESVAPIVMEEDALHVRHLIEFARLCNRKLIENFSCVAEWENPTPKGEN